MGENNFMLKPFILAVMIACFLFTPPEIQSGNSLYLRIENQRTKKVLIEIKVNPGDIFFYDYIHSSDHTPIKDIFRVDKDGKMTLVEEAYLWPGAGLEFHAQHPGGIVYDGLWTKVKLERIFYHLSLRIGKSTQQVLIINNQVYPFSELGKPGDCLNLYLALKENNG